MSTKLKEMELHKHHTIPVGKNLKTLDWHLENLFNSETGFQGWKTIKMMTPQDHRKHHQKHGFGNEPDSYLT